MSFFRYVWRAIKRRSSLRLLLWVVMRLIQFFGWWRSAKMVFRQRRHAVNVAVGVWRTTVRLLRVGRRTWRLIAWIARHRPRLSSSARSALRAKMAAEQRGLGAPETRSVVHRPRADRSDLTARIAHRRDVIRRSVLASMGFDPNWRPNRKPAGAPAGSVSDKPGTLSNQPGTLSNQPGTLSDQAGTAADQSQPPVDEVSEPASDDVA